MPLIFIGLRIYGVFRGSVVICVQRSVQKIILILTGIMFKGIDSNIQFRLAPQNIQFHINNASKFLAIIYNHSQ